jgi:hypothetical protein
MTDEPINWIAVRADYDLGIKKLVDLLDEHHICKTELYARIKAEGWTFRTRPRKARVSEHRLTRSLLIGRLFRLLERQIAQLETNMENPGDKEVAVLGNLTRNLEKLIELDLKEKGRSGKARNRADVEALRKKLADRIEELRRA